MFNNVRSNVIVNIVRTLVLTILSFITFPWVCRCLGEAQLGLYSWAATFVSYFLIIAKIGIPNIAVRECVKVRDDKEKFSNKVQSFFFLQLISTLLSFGLLCAVVLPLVANGNQSFVDAQSIIFILSLNFLTGAFSFEWVFIALEKQFYMSIRSIAVLCISSILVIIFVKNWKDAWIYALVAVSVTILTTIVNLFYVGKFVSFKKTMPYSYKELIKPLSISFALSFCLALYNQTDEFILGLLDQSKVEVGNYSVGVKGIDIVIGVITALSTVFIPRSAYCYQLEDKKYFKNLNRYSVNICLFIVLPAIATMTTLAAPICGLMSGSSSLTASLQYKNAPWVLTALCLMMLTYSLGDIIYGQILLPAKKEKYYLFAIAGGTALNIVLSIILGKYAMPESPSIAVAIGTTVTDLLVIIFLITISWKWTKDALFNKNSLKLFVVALIIAGTSVGISFLTQNVCIQTGQNAVLTQTLQIIITVLVDAIIYIGSLILLKENLVMSFFKKKSKNLEDEHV